MAGPPTHRISSAFRERHHLMGRASRRSSGSLSTRTLRAIGTRGTRIAWSRKGTIAARATTARNDRSHAPHTQLSVYYKTVCGHQCSVLATCTRFPSVQVPPSRCVSSKPPYILNPNESHSVPSALHSRARRGGRASRATRTQQGPRGEARQKSHQHGCLVVVCRQPPPAIKTKRLSPPRPPASLSSSPPPQPTPQPTPLSSTHSACARPLYLSGGRQRRLVVLLRYAGRLDLSLVEPAAVHAGRRLGSRLL